MAATAQSELYEGLIRRIGYSVGLEFLAERVGDLVEVYVSQGAIDGADWRDLVQHRWGRRPQAAEHIADVYAQLELLRLHNSTVQILPTLDILSILFRGPNPLLADAEPVHQTEVLRFVMTMKILEADGDIFLNALASGFRPRDLGARLQALVRHKRSAISPFFKQAGNIRRVMEAVSIRNQSDATDRGKKLTYAQKSRLLLTGGGPGAPLQMNWYEQDVVISHDYLEKTCVTRSGWAEELGFYRRRDGVVASDGCRLLDEARSAGLEARPVSGPPVFAFWPYGFQLRRMSLPPDEIGAPALTPWDVLGAVARTLRKPGGEIPSHENSAPHLDRETWLILLEQAQKLYRTASRRGIIRHDLPLFIAETALAFWLSQALPALPNFRAFLKDEVQRPDRLIDLVMIHGTEGGVRMMREEGMGRGV